ncbi:hypothetical protein F2Q70_00016074 [Brassica cretica]|uniref:Uncharacterized protein n=1 Tax=Brassica cretica TaxID=69181 RepID=A0A8S9I6S3_BRACR|nr:hypothetical protein F2Q70_00016074 [Brassica cretica]
MTHSPHIFPRLESSQLLSFTTVQARTLGVRSPYAASFSFSFSFCLVSISTSRVSHGLVLAGTEQAPPLTVSSSTACLSLLLSLSRFLQSFP